MCLTNDEINPVFLYLGEGGQVQLVQTIVFKEFLLFVFFNLSRSDGLLGYVLRDCKRRSGKARLDLQVVWSYTGIHDGLRYWCLYTVFYVHILEIYIYITAVLLSTESRKEYLVKFIPIYFSYPGAIVIVIYKIYFLSFFILPTLFFFKL